MQIPGGMKPGPSTTFTGFLPTECLGNRIPVSGRKTCVCERDMNFSLLLMCEVVSSYLSHSHPPTGLNILDGAVHMHKFGSSAKVQQFRGNTELTPLVSRRVYDFNYQYFSDLEGFTLMRGDLLKLTCVYDTTSTTGTVYGGEKTEEEMCLYFFAYYPKLPVNVDFILTFSANGQTYCQNGQVVTVAPSRYENAVTPSEGRLECGVRREENRTRF